MAHNFSHTFRTNEANEKFIDFQNEEFKVVPNTHDCYAVSRTGKVISLKHEKPLLLSLNNLNGYQFVNINVSGKFKFTYVHRLVAEAFIPNPDKKRTVNHKDEDKSNNNVDNLEWMTYSENCSYGSRPQVISSKMSEIYANGGVGHNHPVAALDSHDSIVFCFPSIDMAARYTGKDKYKSVKTQISYCIAGKEHCIYAAGYKWTTIDNDVLNTFYEEHPKFNTEISSMVTFLENIKNMERELKRTNRELCKFVVKKTEELVKRSSRQTVVMAKKLGSDDVEGVYSSYTDALRFNCPDYADAKTIGRLRYAMNNGDTFSGYIWLIGDETDIQKHGEVYCAKLNDFIFQEPRIKRTRKVTV